MSDECTDCGESSGQILECHLCEASWCDEHARGGTCGQCGQWTCAEHLEVDESGSGVDCCDSCADYLTPSPSDWGVDTSGELDSAIEDWDPS